MIRYGFARHEKFLAQEVRPLGTTVQLELFGGKASGQNGLVLISTPAPSGPGSVSAGCTEIQLELTQC